MSPRYSPPLCKVSLAVSLSLGLFHAPLSAEELGLIQVDSTTIDDRFDSKRNEPSNIGVISGEQVDAAHSENIQQLLQGIPGITTELQSGDSLKIHIRGVENQVYMGEKPGVAVVIDGVPVFERTGRVNIDLDNIESIKVIKGGASYLFGDDALSGAVIITTKRGAQQAGVKLGAEAGSFGYQKGLLRAGKAGESYSTHVQLSRRETDGYYDDSASKADYVNGKLQYYLSEVSDLTFGFEHADRAKNSHGSVRGVSAAAIDPTSNNVTDYNDYANHYEVLLDKVFLTYSRDFGAGDNLMVNGYQFSDNTQFLSSPKSADPTAYTYDNDYEQVQRGIKGEYRAAGEALAWMAGLDLRANRYDSQVTFIDCAELGPWAGCVPNTYSGDNATDEQVRAAYGELKFNPTAPLVVTVNGRYDAIALDYSDALDTSRSGDKNYRVSSWRLGGNYAMQSNLDLYANASTGFRAPTVEQLFVGTGTPSMRVDPNPELSPEHALSTELGLRTKALGLDVDMALFQLDRKDHIQASSGQYTTSSGNRYENIGDMRSRGLELAVGSDTAKRLSFDLAYTYLISEYTRYDSFFLRTYNPAYDPTCNPYAPPFSCAPQYTTTEYDNTGNEVPRVPRHHLNLNLHLRPAESWLVTTELDAISSYYADEINQERIGGHAVLNLLLNYGRSWGGAEWEFFARVDNLLDRSYYNTARGNSDQNDDGLYNEEDLSIVVNQGRTYTAGLSLRF